MGNAPRDNRIGDGFCSLTNGYTLAGQFNFPVRPDESSHAGDNGIDDQNRPGDRSQSEGDQPPPQTKHKREKPELILPSASIPYIQTAEQCFSELANTKTFFTKAGIPMEIVLLYGSIKLIELEATAFQSRLEENFTLFKWIALPNGELARKHSRCSVESSKVLLKTRSANQLLPPVQIVTSSALFVERDGKIEVLNKGYHNSLGGTLVTKRHKIIDVPLQEAVQKLLALLDDWLFVDPSDKSRALAGILSPALRLGGLLRCDFPLDLAEAEESQSGKTYRQHVIARLYGEEPEILNKKNSHDGGVGSIDENISTALLSGKPFLMFENVREKVDSQILESALRGVGVVQVRRPYSPPQQVSTDRIIWLLSSNKSELTRDLANRTIVTRIQKQPRGFTYKTFSEGDLKQHVTANSDYYLSCILAVLRYWHSKGKRRTNDCRHDFREWCQSLDWTVRNIFQLLPLLDGHQGEQDRISDPGLSWLRDVALNVKRDGRLDEKFRPSEIADICADHGIEIPGCRVGLSPDQIVMQIGKTLKRIFRDTESKLIGGVLVKHSIVKEYIPQRQENKMVNYYEFSLPE